MDLPTVTPEITPNSEVLETTKGIEETPVSEVFSDIPVVVDNQITDDSATSIAPTVEPVLSAEISKEEIEDLTDSDIEKADVNWIGRVEDIIREDKGQPFKEVEDAEELNEEYMKERFNIDVDAPVEEK